MLGDTCTKCQQKKDYVVGNFYNCECTEVKAIATPTVKSENIYVFDSFHKGGVAGPRASGSHAFSRLYSGDLSNGTWHTNQAWWGFLLAPGWEIVNTTTNRLVILKGPAGHVLKPIGPLTVTEACKMRAFKV